MSAVLRHGRRLVFALLAALTVGLAQAEIWRFALIGDTPYSDHERAELPKMLDAIADSHAEFVAHIGDIKHGRDRCDDALFADRYQLFNASRIPFVFIPGDNEWADCDRVNNGAYDPLERLNALRALFWSSPQSLGQKTLTQARQAGSYPEHARFRLGPVLFVTLNLPGGNNNWGLTETPREEWRQRMPVVQAWLKDSFALAKREKLAGVVLLFQANPGFRHFSQGLGHRSYRDFLSLLRDETLAFPGQVVAVHGDTHTSRIDQPLRDTQGKTLANFTRVETHGYPLMGWTKGFIDTEQPRLFRFEAYSWPGKAH
ncbi:metallophosphoesterase [Dechloromonas sp. ZS-1]|uniref:metallophosphoesterase n=1 Tax=Dechloromonas sp. ZS-1 TaxID=3138067 RepID=UPI0031FC9641